MASTVAACVVMSGEPSMLRFGAETAAASSLISNALSAISSSRCCCSESNVPCPSTMDFTTERQMSSRFSSSYSMSRSSRIFS